MSHLGWLLLVLAAVAAVVAVATGRRSALVASVALLAGSAGVLAWALITSDFTFAYVAGQSRRGASFWYRLAGLWGGPEGSLLVFTLLCASAALLVKADPLPPRGGRLVVRLLAVPVAVLSGVTVVLTSPFDRLDAPAVDGAGLTPILEHPAMAVHPPLLYAGLVATLPAFAVAVVGLTGIGRGWPAVRRWLLGSVALLTAAMALGGLWSYAEAGWGGYWAWDPVENTSLAPWMAALVAIHAAQAGRVRAALAMATLPWVLVLAGAAVTRSGATPSVHAFAESDRLGLVLAGLALATVALSAAAIAGAGRHSDDRAEAARSAAPAAAIGAGLLAVAGAVVVVGTSAPVVRRLGGDPGTAVGGWFFADLIAPAALVGAVVLGAVGLRARRRGPAVGAGVAVAMGTLTWVAGWPFGSVVLAATGGFLAVGAVAALAALRRPAWLAHAGLGLLLIGMGASAARVERTVPLDRGEEVRVAGVTVTHRGIEVVDGPRPGTRAVVASLEVRDRGRSRSMRPSLVAYPDRGGVLPETALWARAWHDVQVVLVRADDDQRALVSVRVRPLMSLVWLGALAILVGSGAGALGIRRARRREPVAV